eukprot:366225-Chlamydomonas_euryale.AAC.4
MQDRMHARTHTGLLKCIALACRCRLGHRRCQATAEARSRGGLDVAHAAVQTASDTAGAAAGLKAATALQLSA